MRHQHRTCESVLSQVNQAGNTLRLRKCPSQPALQHCIFITEQYCTHLLLCTCGQHVAHALHGTLICLSHTPDDTTGLAASCRQRTIHGVIAGLLLALPCTAHKICTLHILAATTFVRNKVPDTALMAGPSAARPQISQTLHMLTCSYTQSAGSYKHRFTSMHTTTATSYQAVHTTRWRKGRVFLHAAHHQHHGCTRTPPTYQPLLNTSKVKRGCNARLTPPVVL